MGIEITHSVPGFVPIILGVLIIPAILILWDYGFDPRGQRVRLIMKLIIGLLVAGAISTTGLMIRAESSSIDSVLDHYGVTSMTTALGKGAPLPGNGEEVLVTAVTKDGHVFANSVLRRVGNKLILLVPQEPESTKLIEATAVK